MTAVLPTCNQCQAMIREPIVIWLAGSPYHQACLAPEQLAWGIPKGGGQVKRAWRRQQPAELRREDALEL